MLKNYFPKVPEAFYSLGDINSTFNGLLLANEVHKAFGAYRLSMKPTVSQILYPGIFGHTIYLNIQLTNSL